MRCPTCAAEIGDNPICQRCGSLPHIEARVQKARLGINNFLGGILALLPNRFQAHHFLWACAIIPLFIVPPLVSLIYAIIAMRRQRIQNIAVDLEWIAIVSAINLIISALLLYKLNLFVGDLWVQGQDGFGSFIRRLFQIFWGPQPGSKPTIA